MASDSWAPTSGCINRKEEKGEKGEQSNREYSFKVLASKDLHYICNIIKGRLYMWTGLQKSQNRGKNLVLSKSSFFCIPSSCSKQEGVE